MHLMLNLFLWFPQHLKYLLLILVFHICKYLFKGYLSEVYLRVSLFKLHLFKINFSKVSPCKANPFKDSLFKVKWVRILPSRINRTQVLRFNNLFNDNMTWLILDTQEVCRSQLLRISQDILDILLLVQDSPLRVINIHHRTPIASYLSLQLWIFLTFLG